MNETLFVVMEEDGTLLSIATTIDDKRVEVPAILYSEEDARDVLWVAHEQGKRPMTIGRISGLTMEEE